MKMPSVNKEGYWATHSSDTTLPTPVSVSWKGRVTFLRALARVEKKCSFLSLKDSSICQMCDADLTHLEFSANTEGNIWVWPAGYKHYIEVHQVRPSLAFENFITQLGAAAL